MDSPQQFLKDVVEADESYVKGFSIDLLLGNFRITEFAGIPQPIAEIISAPVLIPFIKNINDNALPISKRIKEVIDNPPECIDDKDLYEGVQYISKVEAPYAYYLIKNTFLDDHVKIPPGTKEYMEKLSRIPLCEDSYYSL
ncbi:MAG: hypothetical protein ACYDG3_14935 [Bacillati bacterium]